MDGELHDSAPDLEWFGRISHPFTLDGILHRRTRAEAITMQKLRGTGLGKVGLAICCVIRNTAFEIR